MRYLLLLIVCFSAGFLYAQEDASFFLNQRKWEIGINATAVLSNFIGNTNDDILTPGDYPLSIKKMVKGGNQALRIGLGGQYTAKKQNFDTPIGQLINYDNQLYCRIGWEWRKLLARRWIVAMGADVSAFRQQSTSHTVSNGDLTTLTKIQAGGGGGPILGIQFAISQRIHLGCEASLYGNVYQKHQSLKFLNSPNENEITNTTEFNVAMSTPKWLYVIVRF